VWATDTPNGSPRTGYPWEAAESPAETEEPGPEDAVLEEKLGPLFGSVASELVARVEFLEDALRDLVQELKALQMRSQEQALEVDDRLAGIQEGLSKVFESPTWS
jgi:hypothetical protein